MILKKTMFANIFYVYEEGDLVGICHDPGEECRRDYFVGDVVKITSDGHGYICPGIKKPGIGMIIGIREDDTDHFFEVKTIDGEVGFCKSARIEVLSGQQLSSENRARLEYARNERTRLNFKKRLREVS